MKHKENLETPTLGFGHSGNSSQCDTLRSVLFVDRRFILHVPRLLILLSNHGICFSCLQPLGFGGHKYLPILYSIDLWLSHARALDATDIQHQRDSFGPLDTQISTVSHRIAGIERTALPYASQSTAQIRRKLCRVKQSDRVNAFESSVRTPRVQKRDWIS